MNQNYRPRGGLEVLLGQLGEGDLVEVGDLEAVAFVDHVSEVRQKLLDGLRHEAELAALLPVEVVLVGILAIVIVVVVL